MINHKTITDTVSKSQHCTRNWDISQTIPEKDIDVIIHALTQCPSKQNHAFYNIHLITNRQLINDIHTHTDVFVLPNGIRTTNSQTLANLLIVFEEAIPSERVVWRNNTFSDDAEFEMTRDKYLAIGVAAGYANFISHLLGYDTGYCAGFRGDKVKQALNLKNNVQLMLGVGFRDLQKEDMRMHHEHSDQIFPAKPKEPIIVTKIT